MELPVGSLGPLDLGPPFPRAQCGRRRDGSEIGTRRARAVEPAAADEVSCAWQCPASCACALAHSWGTGNSPPVHSAGPLAAGMGSNGTRFSKFGNHEGVSLMRAPPCNFKKHQVSWRPPRLRAPTPPALFPAPKFTLGILQIRKPLRTLGRASTQRLLTALAPVAGGKSLCPGEQAGSIFKQQTCRRQRG